MTLYCIAKCAQCGKVLSHVLALDANWNAEPIELCIRCSGGESELCESIEELLSDEE